MSNFKKNTQRRRIRNKLDNGWFFNKLSFDILINVNYFYVRKGTLVVFLRKATKKSLENTKGFIKYKFSRFFKEIKFI